MGRPWFSRLPTQEEFVLLDEKVPHWEERRIYPQPLLLLALLLQHPEGLSTRQLARMMEAEPYSSLPGGVIAALIYRVRAQIGDLYDIVTLPHLGQSPRRYVIHPRMVGG